MFPSANPDTAQGVKVNTAFDIYRNRSQSKVSATAAILTTANRIIKSCRAMVHGRRMLTDFTIFKDLPTETRLQIAKEAAEIGGRYIEIEHDKNGFRPTRASRKIPAHLHVNQEFRREFLRNNSYFMVMFTNDTNPAGRAIYFNPTLDTVYFGARACRETLLCFLLIASRRFPHLSLAKIAILMSDSMCRHKCSCVEIKSCNFCNIMEALHGVDRRAYPDAELARAPDIPGCPGLREITFIQPTEFCQPRDGNFEDFEFRPAQRSGLTVNQMVIISQANLQAQEIRRRNAGMSELPPHVTRSSGIPNFKFDRWTAGNAPTFDFVHWVPRSTNEVYYELLVLSSDDERTRGRDAEIADLAARTGCEIRLYGDRVNSLNAVQEVGFKGTRQQVKLARARLLRFTVRQLF